jgi:hypothetical protein
MFILNLLKWWLNKCGALEKKICEKNCLKYSGHYSEVS